MAYQIPQQLEYKEKIMFGLTFKQLMYGFVFGLLSIAIFRGIPNLFLSILFTIVPSSLGIGFMFLNLEQLIKNYWFFFRNAEIQGGTSEMVEFKGYKEIKDNLIIDLKGKKIAVLKVQPINFSIKPQEEKEAIMFSFQKFLNSLDFPTQILMNTETIDINSYVDSIRNSNQNEAFEELFEKYKKHLQNTIVSDKLMNRIFYVVIPETTDINIQVDICCDRLRTMNMRVSRVYNKGLESLLGMFEPMLILNKESALETVYTKETAPKEGDKVDVCYRRIIYASGYPRSVELGFLDKIVSSLADFNLSIHITPKPIDQTLIGLNRELQKQKADLYTMGSKGISNPSLEIQNKDTRYVLEELQKGKERLFDISLYVACKASTLEELDLLTKKVESELNSLMIIPKIPNLRMLQGLKSCLPLGRDFLKETRNITTEALSAFFPFTSQFLEVDEEGVWIGNNNTGLPIIKDIFKLPNPNGLVLAQSGGGKSYFCKLLITRYLLNGTKTMIIDPQGEYKALVSYFGGQRIEITRESDTIINPLDLMGHDYVEKRLSLIDLMQVMLGKLTESQQSFIDKAISEAYERKGINEDPRTWDKTPPILSDVLDCLNRYEKKATQMEISIIRSLINKLDMYVSGVFSFMNKHTNINFDNNLVCFDIGNMPKQVKPAVMFMVLDYVYMKMKTDLSKKILLIDEAWSLLGRTEDASYIFEIVKTCRKFNLGLLLINQEVEGLLQSKAGKSVLANSAYTLLMRQKPAVIKDICHAFHLSTAEKQHLLTCGVGEGLLIMEDDHSKIKIKASPEEHKVITTNPNELKDREQAEEESERLEQKPTKEVKITLEDNFGCYESSKLNKEEKEYLLRKGYKISEQRSLTSKKKLKYFIKPSFNETDRHFFTIHDIKIYLENKGIKVKTFITKKPDITFEKDGKKWAIEVETGGKIKKDPKMIREKVDQLNKDYDVWAFVMTSKHNVAEYRKLGKVMELRSLRGQIDKFLKCPAP
jgi:conjugal transfer ATP-binding protein TraC